MHELLTIAQMREADARAIAAGTSGRALMERAGQAVAEAAARLAPTRGTIAVLCGPGNNGGDGYVAARRLAEWGFAVTVAALGDVGALTGDAAEAARDWTGPVVSAAALDLARADVVIDALFGAGLARPIDGAAANLVRAINAAGRPVIAVDVPSGIQGDTGQPLGVAVQAQETVTFVRRKPGHLLAPGRFLCGRVTIADIGIGPDILGNLGLDTAANDPALWAAAFPRPGLGGHKYDRGHALVLSGGPSQTGAARLAARAALRMGAGLVTLLSPSDALAVNAAHLTAIMLRACDGAGDLSALLTDHRYNAVVLGPGLGVGERTRALVAAAAKAECSLVLDADALTSFEGDAPALAALIGRSEPRCVITPHGGEFRRLFGAAGEGASKLERARAAAVLLGAVVVDKGPDTVVAAPDGRTAINATGTPYLATAGSGDVLAGMIGGLLAQGMPAYDAACAAVWLHGRASEAVGPGLIAEDLPEQVPGVLRDLLVR